jgi:hypothetical protein
MTLSASSFAHERSLTNYPSIRIVPNAPSILPFARNEAVDVAPFVDSYFKETFNTICMVYPYRDFSPEELRLGGSLARLDT